MAQSIASESTKVVESQTNASITNVPSRITAVRDVIRDTGRVRVGGSMMKF